MSAHAVKPLVEIGLNRGQDDLTISVMLNLLEGLITDANRTQAPITGQGRLFPLLQPSITAHIIKRLDMAVLGPGPCVIDDVAQIGEISFQHIKRAEPVQRLNRVIGIANPAIAIIPITPAIGVFGNRGGESRDNGAGFFMRSEEHTSELQSLMSIP